MARAPFTMKGFSYPGKSPLQDAKQATTRDFGAAGGRERVEQTRGGKWGGSSWADMLPSGVTGLLGGGGGGSSIISAISGIWDMSRGAKKLANKRKPVTTRGDRGYDLGTPNLDQAYVSQHPTIMTS